MRHAPPYFPEPDLAAVLAQSPPDMLHVSNLPAVGILCAIIASLYFLFKSKAFRWGPDVESLLAEKERQILDRDKRITSLEADLEKWRGVAMTSAHTADRTSETNRHSSELTRSVMEIISQREAETTGNKRGQAARGGEATR